METYTPSCVYIQLVCSLKLKQMNNYDIGLMLIIAHAKQLSLF